MVFMLLWCGCGKGVGVIMKLLTFIVRGLGRWEKTNDLLRLVKERCPTMLCIKKTKLEFVEILCVNLFDNRGFERYFDIVRC